MKRYIAHVLITPTTATALGAVAALLSAVRLSMFAIARQFGAVPAVQHRFRLAAEAIATTGIELPAAAMLPGPTSFAVGWGLHLGPVVAPRTIGDRPDGLTPSGRSSYSQALITGIVTEAR